MIVTLPDVATHSSPPSTSSFSSFQIIPATPSCILLSTIRAHSQTYLFSFSFLADGDDWVLAISFLVSTETATPSSLALDVDGVAAATSELVLNQQVSRHQLAAGTRKQRLTRHDGASRTRRDASQWPTSCAQTSQSSESGSAWQTKTTKLGGARRCSGRQTCWVDSQPSKCRRRQCCTH
jgi:hypothetical protein